MPDKDTGLVLTEAAIFDARALARDFSLIRTADKAFGLGVDKALLRSERRIRRTAQTLTAPLGPDTTELFYIAVARQLTVDQKRRLDEQGMTNDRSGVEIWRNFGFTEIAALLEEWQDLARDVQIEIHDDGDTAHGEIANLAEIEERIAGIRDRMQPHMNQATLSRDHITAMVCKRFDLQLKPMAEFNDHWVSRIRNATGFAPFSPPIADADSWHLPDEPFGWLTKRHGAALQSRGYGYRFAFWAQEVGNSRGHLWIETDRGPLVLTDETDAVSQRSVFPVRVSGLDGTHLFDLENGDVPASLMREGPRIPDELSARVEPRRPGNAWASIRNIFKPEK